MQTKELAMMRSVIFAGLVVFALNTSPVFAKEEVEMAPAGPTAAPPSMSSAKGDNAAESINDAALTQPTDTSMAMAASSGSSDALTSFGPSSGTVVGNRALELRDEILRLRASVNLNSNEFAVLRSSGAAGAVQYHSTVAAITARLQNGTTRGNPILLRQWDEASSSLDEVNSSLSRLNSLQTAIDSDASMGSYLLESVQAAFQLSGAVDEDHDQLKLLRDELNRLVVQLDYLRNQTTNDIERQTTYLTTERSNLQALAFAISRGELLGNSLANRPVIMTSPTVMTMPSPPVAAPPPAPYMQQSSFAPPPRSAAPMAVTSGPQPMSPREFMQESGQTVQPAMAAQSAQSLNASNAEAPSSAGNAPTVGRLLVLIRYNQPTVDYESQLSEAVGSAIERRPNAEFSVVAVSPSSGDPADLAQAQAAAQRNAEAVKRSLVQMGLPPSRISMANTQTQEAQTPEVHVYIR